MARADLLVDLVRAGSRGEKPVFKKALEALIAEERSKQHHVLAERLAGYLNSDGSHYSSKPEALNGSASDLLFEITPHRNMNDLILSQVVLTACKELVEEQHRRELLRSYSLEPRNRILLVGPPGNGKTSLAEAIADALMVPLYTIRYEGVIGTYLGETAVRLARLFAYARTRQCVLFFDEFDTLGKERGDVHETGEIKRVVSSLLLQIDALPSHVVVVTATNHSELLDRAVWRRFQLRLRLPAPTRREAEEWFRRFEARLEQPLGHTPRSLADKLKGASFAELEEFSTDVQRQYVLTLPEGNLKRIVAERLSQWQMRLRVHNGGEE